MVKEEYFYSYNYHNFSHYYLDQFKSIMNQMVSLVGFCLFCVGISIFSITHKFSLEGLADDSFTIYEYQSTEYTEFYSDIMHLSSWAMISIYAA